MTDHPRIHVEQTPTPGSLPEHRRLKRIPFRERLPQPSIEYRSVIGKWLSHGESVDHESGQEVTTHPWWKVIWLTGVPAARKRGKSFGTTTCADHFCSF